jgi:hypothetical protein
MPSQPIYKVIFHNGGQVYEVFARQIYQSDMWGFVEIEELGLWRAVTNRCRSRRRKTQK